ncbi:hypothetical protein MTO96_034021 [Rhipicephalus appendiculatus]
MARIPSLYIMLTFLCLSHAETTAKKDSSDVPFEEDYQYFCYQNASDAVAIQGKIYVRIQNFKNPKLPPLCDSAEQVAKLNNTHYIYTLAAVVPMFLNDTLVKFNTSFVLSMTGNHTTYNAMTYQYASNEPPKLRKLMYLSPEQDCMIFVDNRTTTEKPKCQLLQPANYANGSIPEMCLNVYNQNCPGENITVYYPYCQGLQEITLEALSKILQQKRTTTPATEVC